MIIIKLQGNTKVQIGGKKSLVGEIKVGDVWLVDIPNAIGSQQAGRRPFIVCSNNKRNRYSPTIKGITLTSKVGKNSPVHVLLKKSDLTFLAKDSIAICEDVWTLNKFQFIKYLGTLPSDYMRKIAFARIMDEPFLSTAFEEVKDDPLFSQLLYY